MLKQIINIWKIMIKNWVIISNKFRCKEFVWMGNDSKIVCKCFYVVRWLVHKNEELIKNFDEKSDEGYFLEVDIEYPKQSFGYHKELPVLFERKKVEKVEKPVCSIEDKEKYVIHIRVLKQALNNRLK